MNIRHRISLKSADCRKSQNRTRWPDRLLVSGATHFWSPERLGLLYLTGPALNALIL